MQAHTHTHTHTNTQTHTHTHTHTKDHMRTHAERERCTFNLTSLLGHTSAEPKKLGTGNTIESGGLTYVYIIY